MILKKKIVWAALHALVAVCILAVAAPLLRAETPVDSATSKASPSVLEDEEQEGTIGTAAYYARRHHGRRTHSGEIHDRKRLTAAHATLPHGTRVKVINLANDRSVVVTINDRCRKRKDEFIDLSREAARQLGFLGRGKARVHIIPLDDDDEE